MKISVYTCCNDAIEKEFTLFEGVRQAQTFADEIIYVDGGSKDGTLEWMKQFAKCDNRIKVYENPWPVHMLKSATVIQKNFALSKCTGDWCMLMDADEVYSDELVKRIRGQIVVVDSNSGVSLYCQTNHFFYNYECLCRTDPWHGYSWYPGKIYCVKNNLGIHHGNADGDHDGFVDNEDKCVQTDFRASGAVYHYGHVRSNKIYSQKKNAIERRYHPDWKDVEYTLAVKGEDCFKHFTGQHPQTMLNRIKLSFPIKHNDVLNYYERLLNWGS
jgi:glycosyltransferase involved in cell wall biosynthesis